MAAGLTPSITGINLKPVVIVAEWARQNHIRNKFDEKPVTYAEFKEIFVTEGR